MRRALFCAAAATSASLIILGAATSAHAYPLETHYGHTSPDHGYGAYEVNSGGYGIIYAWDDDSDGYRIVTWVYNLTQGGDLAGYAYDANGNNDSSGAAVYDYAGHAGDSMKMVTCRQNGASGRPFDCGNSYFSLPY